ncbi:MAG: hypothetical protein IT173_04910 [Acidobacteria bacterium]|nr:hypothetical protein [Acidobacteriota bacterium]
MKTIIRLLLVMVIFDAACIRKTDIMIEPIAFENVCGSESDGKTAAVKGYLWLPDKVSCRGSKCELELRSSRFGGDKIGIQVQIGDRPGQMERLHGDYSYADLKLHTTTGVAGNEALVELTGKIWFSDLLGAHQCWIEVDSATSVMAVGTPQLKEDPQASSIKTADRIANHPVGQK